MSPACAKLHNLFNSMPKMRFPFDRGAVPENGIYILFEKGEFAHGTDRIVRVGTHTGNNQLRSRLWQHFENENKDRSIFRKNIGRALLSKTNNPFLNQWEIDLTTKKAKEQFADKIDFKLKNETEKEVSIYIQKHFSFVAFRVDQKEERLRLETRIISTIANCEECKPSENWLGKFCANERFQSKRTFANCLKLSKSGLWLVKGLSGTPFTELELDKFVKRISNNDSLQGRI